MCAKKESLCLFSCTSACVYSVALYNELLDMCQGIVVCIGNNGAISLAIVV